MDTFKFLIDPNETRVTIDCSSYQQALYSVASLLKREPDEMLSSIYKIGNTLKFNHSQGVFEEILAEQVVGERYFSINVDKVCWFHFTRVHISLTYKEGLLPSKKNVSKVWENLVNIFSPIDRKIRLKKFCEEIESNEEAILLEIKSIKNNDTFVLPSNKSLWFFPIRAMQQSIKYFYKIKPANRNKIILQLTQILNSNLPVSIIRTDIKSFYESINFENLIDKIYKDGILAVQHLRVLKSMKYEYNRLLKNDTGIPRGVGICAYLAELYLKNFDEEIKAINQVLYYARFVDDIVVIIREEDGIALSIFEEMKEKIRKIGLTLHDLGDQKGKSIICTNDKINFDYLGYNISKIKNKNCSIEIAESKIEKIINRIDATATAYFIESKSNYKYAKKLLFQRLSFLTSVTRLSNLKSNVVTGLPVSYMLLTGENSINKLNEHLENIWGKLPKWIPQSSKDNFIFSINKDIKSKPISFKPMQLKKIVRIWK